MEVQVNLLCVLQSGEFVRRTSIVGENLPKFIFDTSIDAKKRARLLEKEMNEQAKIVQDLR